MRSTRKKYLLVDKKKFRRNSAPEYLGNVHPVYGTHSVEAKSHYWLRASTSDLSVLLDNQSESGSSLELDTSNLCRDFSPTPVRKDCECIVSQGSYQSIPVTYSQVYRENEEECSIWSILRSYAIWKAILLSQGMAGCLTVINLSNKYGRRHNHNTIGECFVNYVILSILWTPRLALRNNDRGFLHVLKHSGFRYILLSALHVEANYFLFTSFQKDSYMGNQTIDFVAALLSIILAYVCLDVEFQLTHVNGFATAVIGAICFCILNAFSRIGENEISWGDVLRIGSGIFLALNNLAQELIVKSIDSVEYLGMVGFFGSVISGVQTLLSIEYTTVSGNFTYWVSIISLPVSQVIFSCLAPAVLRDIGTTGLHLALLSSEFYSYLANSVIENERFQLLYLAAYGLVLCGSYMFVLKRTYIGTHYFFPVKVTIPKGN